MPTRLLSGQSSHMTCAHHWWPTEGRLPEIYVDESCDMPNSHTHTMQTKPMGTSLHAPTHIEASDRFYVTMNNSHSKCFFKKKMMFIVRNIRQ